MSSRRRRREERRRARIKREARNRGNLIQEQVRRALRFLREEGRIVSFKEFPRWSPEDRAGWDFVVFLSGELCVPIDATTTDPRNRIKHLQAKGKRKRLVFSVDLFLPLSDLANQILAAINNYEHKISASSFLMMGGRKRNPPC